ncbi:HEAT repeat domain-containing protein [Mucisphaera sp.]|uniref:HEAT repeat domain-containing protein n=1 Tax=Mucisphaera sp. TaxID=2913024 RepID=UPI003D14FD3C
MLKRRIIFQTFCRELPSFAAQALLHAIDASPEQEQHQLVDLALSRSQPTLLRGLIRRFEALPTSCQQPIADKLRDHLPLIREALSSTDHRKRIGAIGILQSLNDHRHLDLLGPALADDRPTIRTTAELLLLRWTRLLLSDTSPPDDRLTGAYSLAANFRRIQHGPSQAIAWCFAVTAPLLGRDADPILKHAPRKNLIALRALLAEAADPLVIERLPWWLARTPTSDAAERGLNRQHQQPPTKLGYSETVVLAARQPSLTRPGEPLAAASHRLGLAAIPGLIARHASTPLEKIALLADLVTDGSPVLRSVALRQLIGLTATSGEAVTVLTRFLADHHEPIAQTAMTWLLANGASATVLKGALQSHHASVRTMAAQRLAPGIFKGLCRNWPKLNNEHRQQSARQLMRLDDRLVERLDDLLRRPERENKLRAMAMIRELNLGVALEPRLADLAASKDERLASAAVAALGQQRTPQSMQIIDQALEHKDPRVRANAVEALGTPRDNHEQRKLLALLRTEHNRVRANAIASLIPTDAADQAIRGLSGMLDDPREPHRVSGIWVAQTCIVEPVTPKLIDMAAADPSTNVRRRAYTAASANIQRIEQETAGATALLANMRSRRLQGAA